VLWSPPEDWTRPAASWVRGGIWFVSGARYYCGLCGLGLRGRCRRNRGPVSAKGIYEMIKRRGKQAGVHVYPHRFRYHFSHTWLDRDGPGGDLMELNGWVSRRC
jgi:integrase